MIIVKVIGGLGNQFFQYAAGKALAERKKTELKLDVSAFVNYDLRKFDLSQFAANFQIANEEDILRCKAKNSLERVIWRITPYPNKRFYKQPYFHFDKRFFNLSRDVYLQGYFQSERYFSPIQPIIRREYKLKDIPASLSQIIHEIQTSNSVAIHVRRGDYKNLVSVNVHGILPIDYYKAAINYIKAEIPNPKFYLFSDNLSEVLTELNEEGIIPISDVVTKSHFEDFHLMTQCKHNVIANSSFSWWAAWLNENQSKIVVAPKKWFNNGPKDTYDIYPNGWKLF